MYTGGVGGVKKNMCDNCVYREGANGFYGFLHIY